MAVVAYFLFELIAEASGPQAKIMTRDSLLLNVLFLFLYLWRFHSPCVSVCQCGTKRPLGPIRTRACE